MEEHDKEVRMCTSEPVKGTRAKSNGKGEKNRRGGEIKKRKRGILLRLQGRSETNQKDYVRKRPK